MLRQWLFAALASASVAGTGHNGQSMDTQIESLWDARMYDQAYARLSAMLDAEPNDATAHRLMARSYAEGFGVAPNKARQVHHLRRAAQSGDAASMYALGEAYANGNGVAQSAISALSWFERGASEHPEAAFRYAEIHLANPGHLDALHDPVERLRFAATHESARAQHLMATLIASGTIEAVDAESPSELLKKAARSLPEARTQLGVIHHRRGEHREAAEAFQAAQTAGDRRAAAYLGHYAEAGIDGPIDRTSALTFYRQAGEVAWAITGAKRIEAHLRSIEILGLRIYASTRSEVRARLAEQGFEGVGGEAHFDAYDVTELFEAAERGVLTAGYAPGTPSFLAELHYRFEAPDARRARQLWLAIDESLTDRYGAQKADSRDMATHIRQWRIENIEIQLRFNARERRIHVTYHMVPFIDQLAAFLNRQPQEKRGPGDVF